MTNKRKATENIPQQPLKRSGTDLLCNNTIIIFNLILKLIILLFIEYLYVYLNIIYIHKSKKCNLLYQNHQQLLEKSSLCKSISYYRISLYIYLILNYKISY